MTHSLKIILTVMVVILLALFFAALAHDSNHGHAAVACPVQPDSSLMTYRNCLRAPTKIDEETGQPMTLTQFRDNCHKHGGYLVSDTDCELGQPDVHFNPADNAYESSF